MDRNATVQDWTPLQGHTCAPQRPDISFPAGTTNTRTKIEFPADRRAPVYMQDYVLRRKAGKPSEPVGAIFWVFRINEMQAFGRNTQNILFSSREPGPDVFRTRVGRLSFTPLVFRNIWAVEQNAYANRSGTFTAARCVKAFWHKIRETWYMRIGRPIRVGRWVPEDAGSNNAVGDSEHPQSLPRAAGRFFLSRIAHLYHINTDFDHLWVLFIRGVLLALVSIGAI